MKRLLLRQRQFLLYCSIGAGGASLDYGVFSLLVKTKLLHIQAANALSYAGGTLLSFGLNARFNFRVTSQLARRLAGFLGVALLGWGVSAGLLQMLIGGYGWNIYLSKLAVLAAVVVLQYNLNRWISFRPPA